jgi:hypothetical protein
MISYSSYALEIYSAVQQARSNQLTRETNLTNANNDYAQRKAQKLRDKVKEAFGGTMGTLSENEESNNMMYNLMCNPFTNHKQAVPAWEINQEHKLF